MSLVLILIAGLTPTVLAADLKPTDGWTLHVDAKRHFPSKPDLVAHHYCKDVSGGLTECQIYDSDRPDAKLVGVEVIVGPEIYQTFSAAEKRRWHAHKTEIPKVSATLPDLSLEEAAQVVKKLKGTYGKVYLLWDPGKGQPKEMGSSSVLVMWLTRSRGDPRGPPHDVTAYPQGWWGVRSAAL